MTVDGHRGRRALRVARWGLLMGALAMLAICRQSEPAPVMLELNGFNYTDLYIDSFEVNGQGGGNLFVSSPTSGGGGGVCCVSFHPDPPLPVQLTIQWTRDGQRWCEKEALLAGPVPANPRHLGVHFFPDGHIEAEITEDHAEPKLKLARVSRDERKESGNTVADEQSARCRDGYLR